MNRYQRKHPRIKEKVQKLPYTFRSYKGLGSCRAWKNSDFKSYLIVPYENNSVNLSLIILDCSMVSGSENKKVRKQHIYRAAKMMKL